MVKAILKEQKVDIPDDVTVTLKSKVITVKGKRGELARSFKSMPVQINEIREGNKLKALSIRVWFAKNKPASCINTISTLIRNMITGVSKGFLYTMKFGYKLHPMQPVAVDNGKAVNINNYLGKKYITKIEAQDGCVISTANAESKKEIMIEGSDKELIGITASQINQKNRPRNKDKRVFRDGIFIFSREVMKA